MKAKLIGLVFYILVSIYLPRAASSASANFFRVLYPSFAGSWATAWIAKEAGYFSEEG